MQLLNHLIFLKNRWKQKRSHGTYNTNKQIKFKTILLKLNLCHYSDMYILVKGTITVETQTSAALDRNDKEVILIA